MQPGRRPVPQRLAAGSTEATTFGAGTPLPGQPPLVLVADDQSANVQLIGQMLDQAGYDVMPARSGEQALARTRARKPDLILLDMLMPGMDGSATCRALREAGFGDVPVIFVTGAADRDSLVTAFAAGAVDYITKPFVAEELLARVRTHLDLKLARDRLGEMLREREDVMHVVAHDLKNPLSATLFAARMLRRAPLDAAQSELLDDVVHGAEEALQFIQRFLARGAEGQRLRQFRAESIELGEVAARAVRAQRAAAQSRGMDILVQGAARAWADPTVARNVVQNLLSNAIRYAPEGSPIEVEIGDSRTGHARLLVMDRGPGVPEELRTKLFRSYARLVSAREAPADPYSSGLGLAIAKHDVVQMGGHLWYEPRSGGGAIFGIELPQQRESGGAFDG